MWKKGNDRKTDQCNLPHHTLALLARADNECQPLCLRLRIRDIDDSVLSIARDVLGKDQKRFAGLTTISSLQATISAYRPGF